MLTQQGYYDAERIAASLFESETDLKRLEDSLHPEIDLAFRDAVGNAMDFLHRARACLIYYLDRH